MDDLIEQTRPVNVQVSVEGQLPAHRGKPNRQQGPGAAVELPKELERLRQKTRSLERCLPGSLSSPSLLADVPERSEAADNAAVEQTKDTAAGKIHRAMSLDQMPAVISRMTSWKEASKDYSAMQVHLPLDAWISSTHNSCMLHQSQQFGL